MAEERLLQALRRSPKYGGLDGALLGRVAATMAARYKKESDALDAAKRHLHVICGMYQGPGESAKAGRLLSQALSQPPTPERVQALSLEILALHASTRERLPDMQAFYGAIFGALPEIRSILDLGCGLHPFARPFLPVGAGCAYTALDLLPETARQIGAFFDWAGYAGRAGVMDLAAELPRDPADLAFALKLLPVLEQQRKGRGAQALHALPARFAAVSFPTRSIGGKRQGMAAFYGDWLRGHIGPWRVLLEREIGSELLFLLEKKEEEANEEGT